MAPITVIMPGTGLYQTYPGKLVANPKNLPVGDAENTPGNDLLNHLYPFPNDNPNGNGPNPNQALADAQGNFERNQDEEFKMVPKSGMEQAPAGVRGPTEAYKTAERDIKNDYASKTVVVSQRAWAVTDSSSARPLISTYSLALCICIIIYDPKIKQAALAHVDEDQRFSTVVDIITTAFNSSNPLEIHFYGGKSGYSMGLGSRKNLVGQLNALYAYNASLPSSRLTISAFDVMLRPHTDSITFDTRNGAKYPVWWTGPPEYMGLPLDSKFRYWINRQYIPEMDGSAMANLANDLEKADKALVEQGREPQNTILVSDLKKIRCQWFGTLLGLPGFVKEVNELVSRLTVEYAITAAQVQYPNGVTKDLINVLVAENKPMMIEQSLKRWYKFTLLSKADQDKSPLGKAKFEQSFSYAVIPVLQANEGKAAAVDEFKKALAKWVKKGEYSVPWEGRY